MNRTMGRFLDEATDEMRDRVITAVEMNDGSSWWDYLGECGCLYGTAFNRDIPREVEVENARWPRNGSSRATTRPRLFAAYGRVSRFDRDGDWEVLWRDAPAWIRYPYAVERFGKDRVVRAIKARAAKSNRIPLAPSTEHATETAHV